MKKEEIQTVIKNAVEETLIRYQDDSNRSACKTYSQLMNDANVKLEKYQKKNETIHQKIIEKLDTHLERYAKDREESRVNNNAIFTQLSELTEELKKNSEFRLENGDSLEVIRDALTTIRTNKRWLTWVAGIVGSFVVIKDFFRH